MTMDGDSGVLAAEWQAPQAEADPVASAVDQAILRVRAGDLAAFEELMVLTEAKVLALAWRLLGDRDPARDAVQEVYLRVYRSLDGFRLGENFAAWIYRITCNVCADHGRRRGPATLPCEVLEQPGLIPAGPSAESALLLEERRALVRRGLARLTPAERSALVLRDLEGFSTEAVAKTLGVRPVTVRSQICSARAKLQAFCTSLLASHPGGES